MNILWKPKVNLLHYLNFFVGTDRVIKKHGLATLKLINMIS